MNIKKALLLKTFLIINLIILIFRVFWGAHSAGIGRDEPNAFRRGKDLLLLGRYIFTDSDSAEYAYGPLPGFLSYVANALVQQKSISDLEINNLFIQISHLTIGFVGIIGAFVVGVLIFLLTKNLNYSLVAVITLLSLPIWLGNSFHNVKDIPVATGYTLITTTCAYVLSRESLSRNKINFLLVSLGLFTGFVLAAGTRPFLSFLFSMQIMIVVLILTCTKKLFEAKLLIFVFFLSLLSLALLLPQFRQNFVFALQQTIFNSSNYPWQSRSFGYGQYSDAVLTFEYLYNWLLHTVPVLYLIFMLLGLILSGVYIIRSFFVQSLKANSIILVLVLSQILFLLIVGMVLKTTVYTGLRQFLFIFPPITVLMVWSIYKIQESIKFKRMKFLTMFSFFVYLIIVNYETSRLYPYEYIYYNELTTRNFDVAISWPTDYWGVSVKEAIRFAPSDVNLNSFGELTWPESLYEDLQGSSAGSAVDVLPGDFFAVSEIYMFHGQDSVERMLSTKSPLQALKPKCTSEKVVTRQLRTQIIPISFVARCQNSGHMLDGIASIAWSSSTEVDQNNMAYSWVETAGENIRITNLQKNKIDGYLEFLISPNPCKTKVPISIVNATDLVAYSLVTPEQEKISFKVPLSINKFQTKAVKILPTTGQDCLISDPNENRNFLLKISEVNWRQI